MTVWLLFTVEPRLGRMEKVPTWPSAGSGYCSLVTTLATDSTSVVIYCIITVKDIIFTIYKDITLTMFIVILPAQSLPIPAYWDL